MCRFVLTFIFILSLLLPQVGFAETDETFEKQRCKLISHLAEQILDTEFQPVTITVNGQTREKALARAVKELHAYLDNYRLSPVMCKCFEYIGYVTTEERALLTHWGVDVFHSASDEEGLRVVLTLDKDQLVQLALFNLWPLLNESFES